MTTVTTTQQKDTHLKEGKWISCLSETYMLPLTNAVSSKSRQRLTGGLSRHLLGSFPNLPELPKQSGRSKWKMYLPFTFKKYPDKHLNHYSLEGYGSSSGNGISLDGWHGQGGQRGLFLCLMTLRPLPDPFHDSTISKIIQPAFTAHTTQCFHSNSWLVRLSGFNHILFASSRRLLLTYCLVLCNSLSWRMASEIFLKSLRRTARPLVHDHILS